MAERKKLGHRLEIKANGRSNPIQGYGMTVSLDGMEIKCTHLELNIGQEEVNTCTITFVPGDVAIDAEVLAELQAMVAKQQDD